jgi:hypothetical protein
VLLVVGWAGKSAISVCVFVVHKPFLHVLHLKSIVRNPACSISAPSLIHSINGANRGWISFVTGLVDKNQMFLREASAIRGVSPISPHTHNFALNQTIRAHII